MFDVAPPTRVESMSTLSASLPLRRAVWLVRAPAWDFCLPGWSIALPTCVVSGSRSCTTCEAGSPYQCPLVPAGLLRPRWAIGTKTNCNQEAKETMGNRCKLAHTRNTQTMRQLQGDSLHTLGRPEQVAATKDKCYGTLPWSTLKQGAYRDMTATYRHCTLHYE